MCAFLPPYISADGILLLGKVDDASAQQNCKVKEVPHEENKKTVVALNSNRPSPADREGLNSHDSLHSVCVQGCRLSDV